ncbi:MAG: hypothetical protein B0D92_00540 [Spirochaeta sp. LUC14_002_19_P3]|nr:MAG: hypothetical protein B0D92_00540 [Spirochaeta sp. LUC14_002_19_P3]
MKKGVFLVAIAVLAAVTLPAKTELINIGYNTYNNCYIEGTNFSNVGLSVTGVYDNNFYFQLNLNYAMAYELNGVRVELKSTGITSVGVSTILGIGHDFKFGPLGLVLGAGVFGDFSVLKLDVPWYTDSLYHYYYLTGGLAAGANVFIKLGGNFVINAGIMGAWNPLTYSVNDDTKATKENQAQFSANIGIGWNH